ncbi:unnamed protein product [Rotaria sp. Silwood1]|nr:unnamed protein product [Rotaria sp. Silwood1]
MRNVALSHPVDHSTSQQHITNNRTVQNQGSVSSSTTHSNSCTNQPLLLSHCFPVPSTDSVITNQSSSSNVNNTTIHCPMLNHPCYTTNCHHQSPLNFRPYHQRAATSNDPHNSTSNMNQLQVNHQQHLDNQNVTPMESENDNCFTLVKRKKKTKKIDVQQNQKSSSSFCSSSPTSSTNGSTSSTNTNSIISHVQPRSAVAVHLQPNLLEVNAPVAIINPFSIEISQQAQHYAETRYAFPSFIIKFQQDNNESSVLKYLTTHYSYNYNSNLNFAGHRLKLKRDLLLFVNDRESFSMLYDASKWPSTIESLNFEKILPNHLPPQFSLVLKNVPFDIEIDTLLTNIKSIYPDVMNAHRILNKNQHPTTLVRLDINNINVIDELVGSHDSNDVRCPDVKTYRAVLTKSLLAKTSTMNHQQNNQSKFHYKDQDYPSLNMNYNNNHHRINNLSNISSKRIDELYHKLSNLEGNLNRLLDLNNNYADQRTRTQQIIMNHNRDIQLQQIDGAFQRDFVSQFISPICQVMVEVIPVLVKQNVLNDKTLLCPSLLALCAKLGNDLQEFQIQQLLTVGASISH